ncbi:MAG: bifunctional alpha/beta hydrolase/OsmC family protein [Pseudomonadota bacterium]
MTHETIRFENRTGQTLAGIIDWPADRHGGYRALAIFAHCFTCTKNLKAVTHIAESLNARGIAVMRFDFTGLGQSDGDFADTTFASNVSDIIDAAQYLGEHYTAPTLLIGHSLGGTATLMAAAQIESALAVATIGSPASPEHVTHLFDAHTDSINQDGQAKVLLAGRPFTIKREFVESLHDQPLTETVQTLGKALLFLHSPIDDTVGVDNAATLFNAAKHPRSFVSLDHADHLLSDAQDSRYVGEVLAGWADRYLPPVSEPLPDDIAGDVIASTSHESFRTRLNIGGHRLIADEPTQVGGSNSGPTPVALLRAALASCTTMTLQMYARHKGLPVDDVTVGIEQDQVKKGNQLQTTFTRHIRIEGDLDATQHQRMLEIADRCPVHRALHGQVDVINVVSRAASVPPQRRD